MSREEIIKLEQKLNEADSNQNLDTRDVVEELFDDKCVIVGPTGATLNKDTILSYHTISKKPYTRVITEKLDITVFDDSAIVHSTNTYYTETNEPLKIIFLRVWRKKNGQWKIVGGSANQFAKT